MLSEGCYVNKQYFIEVGGYFRSAFLKKAILIVAIPKY